MLIDGNYTPVARQKIAALVRRQDFVSIEQIDSNRLRVQIGFADGKTCMVDSWGKVLWSSPEDHRAAATISKLLDS